MKAELWFHDRFEYADGAIREMKIWKLPAKSSERPHGLKYSLFYGYSGQSLVRYDNERGKGDHRHYGDLEEPYSFTSAEKLIEDFRSDIMRSRRTSP